jgi:hypothetical protein
VAARPCPATSSSGGPTTRAAGACSVSGPTGEPPVVIGSVQPGIEQGPRGTGPSRRTSCVEPVGCPGIGAVAPAGPRPARSRSPPAGLGGRQHLKVRDAPYTDRPFYPRSAAERCSWTRRSASLQVTGLRASRNAANPWTHVRTVFEPTTSRDVDEARTRPQRRAIRTAVSPTCPQAADLRQEDRDPRFHMIDYGQAVSIPSGTPRLA